MPVRPSLKKRIFDIVDRNLTKFVDKQFPVPGVNTDVETEQPQEPQPQEPAHSRDVILYRIREAASQMVKVYLQYDNTWRYVEPYELSAKGKGGALVLFGRCSLHPNDPKGKPFCEMFRVDRIQDCYLTDQVFVPTWQVKI